VRRKFFVIVFAFLVSSIVVVSTLQVLFFESERLRLLDQRLETIASSLIASGLSLTMIQNLESTDDLINDLLGEERIDHIINVYSLTGQVLAQNFTAMEIPLKFSTDEVHQTYDVDRRTVRVLNIKNGRLIVQVGVVLGPGPLNYFLSGNARSLGFTLLIFTLLVVAAYFSSGILFRPLRNLTRELRSMSNQLDRKLGQSLTGFVIGPELARLSRSNPNTKDEFEILCMEIEEFLKKLGTYTRSFNAQTAILTHELKTPLTILRNYLEELQRAKDLGRALDLGKNALGEIDRLTQLINDYLQWSVLTSNPEQPADIYAVKVSETVSRVVNDLNRIHNNRISLKIEGDSKVLAMPDHVRQLVTNIISNALNYTDGAVEVTLRHDQLEIADHGKGLPKEVEEHLGSPFNRGKPRAGTKSSGLGLAWIHSLCEKYSWKLQINSQPTGTQVTVNFA
jgi:signal transduction histidine kinase